MQKERCIRHQVGGLELTKLARYIAWLPLILGFVASLASCDSIVEETRDNDVSLATTELVDFPTSSIAGVLWLPDGSLLVKIDLDAFTDGYFLYAERQWSRVFFPDDDRCQRLIYSSFELLADGRIGAVKDCGFVLDGKQVTEETLIAISRDFATAELLVSTELPPIGGRSFSWNPEITQGIQIAGSLYNTMYWLTPDGIQPLDLILGVGRESWLSASALDGMLSEREGLDTGRLRVVDWAPDGSKIAFFVSNEALGRTGFARTGSPMN